MFFGPLTAGLCLPHNPAVSRRQARDLSNETLIFQLLAGWGAAVRLRNLHVHFLSVFLVHAACACRQQRADKCGYGCVSAQLAAGERPCCSCACG